MGYWGDLDTWGLTMLARARTMRPDLTPLLMNAATFDAHEGRAVPEPRPAEAPTFGLTPKEQALFERLAGAPRGRLEQELVSAQLVIDTVTRWAGAGIPIVEQHLRSPARCHSDR